MPDDFALPDSRMLTEYLKFSGWTALPPGRAGTLWSRGDVQVGVPHFLDDDLMRAVIESIAAASQQPARLVANEARYLLLDVMHLRAANDYRITDTIPLETAATIIASAKMMLRATATTAHKAMPLSLS